MYRLKFLSKKRVLCVAFGKTLFYHRGKIIIVDSNSPSHIERSIRIGNFLSRFVFISRLFRLEPRAAVALNGSFFISCCGKILRIDSESNRVFTEHIFEKGMRNPLSFCVGEDSNGEKCLLYGEYIWNDGKGPVSIYRRNKTGEWLIVYSFPNNSITHIHNLLFDSQKKRYIVLTGDEDSESGIWLANIDFSKTEPVVIGNQSYRSCVALIDENKIFYATDTPLEPNNFYCLDILSLKRSKVAELPGSVIYGRSLGDSLFFSSCVEPDSTIKGWRYRFTRRLGKGIKDRFAHLFVFQKGIVQEITRIKKDFLPMWLFGFGTFLFPYSDDGRVYVTLQSLASKHGYSYILEKEGSNVTS